MDEDDYFGEEFEEDIYSAKEAEELLEEDYITAHEEGFMKGYDDEKDGLFIKATCRFCRYELDIEDRTCPSCGTSTINLAEAI